MGFLPTREKQDLLSADRKTVIGVGDAGLFGAAPSSCTVAPVAIFRWSLVPCSELSLTVCCLVSLVPAFLL
jgi:hypothetical protein